MIMYIDNTNMSTVHVFLRVHKRAAGEMLCHLPAHARSPA